MRFRRFTKANKFALRSPVNSGFHRGGSSELIEAKNGGRWQIRTADPLRVMQVL
jgi:hypothetical protein